ncbi:MAG: UDP-N-acetylmuramate dehydrogenase [Actinobacteria bacterium]|nr:UDP-N-acetylmuramate dehydrogenase [Actinomycetota bacterium]
MSTRERLSSWTTLRTGGPAARFVEVTNDDELIAVVHECDERGEPVLLIAGGSNLGVGDDGFAGTVVKISTHGITVEKATDGTGYAVLVRAAAGESWDRLAAQMAADSYSGIETLSGIPGSVGATPIQNVGAYGNEVAQTIESVEVYDRIKNRRRVFSADECEFGYRTSRFKKELDRWLILGVTLRLERRPDSVPINYADLAKQLQVTSGDRAPLGEVRRGVLAVRRGKGMVLDIDDYDTWSVGSFFTNPIVLESQLTAIPDDAPRWPTANGKVKLSAAWLIDNAGFPKGYQVSPDARASTSTKHTLALTNRGTARAVDVVELASSIRRGVSNKFGLELEPEPRLINCALH